MYLVLCLRVGSTFLIFGFIVLLFLGTPLHWAVLNGRVDAVRALLKFGCNASPPKPKINNRSSAAVESPLEICIRLYGESPTDERAITLRSLLEESIESNQLIR